MTFRPATKGARLPPKKCPNADCKNMLTSREAKLGYQCAACTAREEGPW